MKRTLRKRGLARNVIGSRVRKARLASNPAVTQEDLAGRLAALDVQMDRSAISRIESQDRYVMDYEAQAFDQDVGAPQQGVERDVRVCRSFTPGAL